MHAAAYRGANSVVQYLFDHGAKLDVPDKSGRTPLAVADGVDVINYSISGTLTNFLDPVEVSFLYAARAGIFVAESAGNSGPTTSTVAHPDALSSAPL